MTPRPPLSPTTFRELAVRARLLTGEPDDAPVDAATAAEYAERLVQATRLTRFQATKLLAGLWQGLVIGPYRLMCPIGRGGVGIVYLARDDRRPGGERTPRLVALKLLSPKRAREEPRTLARFRREMELGPTVPPHPHLARTLEAGVADGVNFVVMEYVPGLTARRVVKNDGPMSVPVTARVFADVASGLHAAHTAGFVHRDTKPANVIVTPSGRAKLLDFGFALRRGEMPNADPSIIGGKGYTLGTTDYLPPEQASNAVAVGAETDIYSLGCSLYFVLTGHPPFPAGTAREKIRAHQITEPPPIRSLNPAVPEEFIALVMWLMSKRPENRPQSAQTVADELERWARPAIPIAERLSYDTEWEAAILRQVEASGAKPAESEESPANPDSVPST